MDAGPASRAMVLLRGDAPLNLLNGPVPPSWSDAARARSVRLLDVLMLTPSGVLAMKAQHFCGQVGAVRAALLSANKWSGLQGNLGNDPRDEEWYAWPSASSLLRPPPGTDHLRSATGA